MSFFSTILVVLVSFEFFYIMYLETFATQSNTTSRVFNIKKEELRQKNLNIAFKNQGVYNGLIGIELLYTLFFINNPTPVIRLILIYIILVALYGSLTSNKKIILTQGGLAIITLISTFF